MTTAFDPDLLMADLCGVQIAHNVLRLTLGTLTDADMRRPSGLPVWSVGHVLTHLARNADSHCNMLEGAIRGACYAQYPGGWDQRNGDIEEGARRGAKDIVADVEQSIQRLEGRWASMSESDWEFGTCRSSSGVMPLAIQPLRRWREVEIHHHDLEEGFSWRSWSDAYVARELSELIATLGSRVTGPLELHSSDSGEVWSVPKPGGDTGVVVGSRRELLAWIVGRYDPPGYPSLGRWI